MIKLLLKFFKKETILTDLDAGYVDPVDTKKLFETGVSAMLRSLDPYTEFEAREEAFGLSFLALLVSVGIGLVSVLPGCGLHVRSRYFSHHNSRSALTHVSQTW